MKPASIAWIAALALAGCATGGSTMHRAPTTTSNVDTARMAQIEREARARGVDVVWINPPTIDKH
jgi:hypothetical protein